MGRETAREGLMIGVKALTVEEDNRNAWTPRSKGAKPNQLRTIVKKN
jgi:hypothetical protein